MINQEQNQKDQHKDKKLEQLCEDQVSLPKNNTQAPHEDDKQQTDARKKQDKSGSRPSTSKSKKLQDDRDDRKSEEKQNNKQHSDQEEGKKVSDQQDDDQVIKRASLKSIRNSSKLMRKYKQKSRNSSRLGDQEQNNEQPFKSTSSLNKRRKLSAVLKQPSDRGKEKTIEKEDESDLKDENKKLKNKVAFLMQELKNIQLRLNKELSKRGSPVSLKNVRHHSVDTVSSKQIQNAEKRCKIYQKQIVGLKAKVTLFNQQKINELTDKVQKLEEKNGKLEDEKKQLKKNCKHFEKIIDQMGDGDYLKIREENQELKKQNRKLKQKVKKQEQEERMEKLSASNQKAKTKRQNEKKEEEKKKEEQKQAKEINILKSKSQRDDKKIKALTFEGNQHKEKIEQLNKDIQEKNKQIESLKEKIKSMKRLQNKKQKERKQNDEKNKKEQGKKQQNEHKNKDQQKNSKKQDKEKEKEQPEDRKQKKQKSISSKTSRAQSKLHLKQSSKNQKSEEQRKQSREKQRMQESKQKEQSGKKSHSIDSQKNEQSQQNHQNKKQKTTIKKAIDEINDSDKMQKNQGKSNNSEKDKCQSEPKGIQNGKGKYPRKIQKGQSHGQSYKWNHHAFSSKVKLVEVMPHPNGHIKCLNFRYEKGEPPKIQKGTYASFVCDQNSGQFIKKISGGFKSGVLQYIKVATNKKRQSTFCKHELAEQCQNFTFGTDENEYPCAFFGENVNESIVRFGCFIEAIKQK